MPRTSIRVVSLSRLIVLSLVVLFGLGACSWINKIKPFKADIRQGNYVTQEMVAQLTQGMNEEQVRFIMGSPLLVDPFHANRWDYVYRFAPQGVVSETRRITLLFKDGKLSSVEGDVVAAIPPARDPEALKLAPQIVPQSAPKAAP